MTLTAAQRFKIKKFVNELSRYRARHTELVSVYIPAGYDINKITNHLIQEKGTAENIKSPQTRKNVKDALERMIQHLKLYKQTPPNGLAVFSGNVAEKEGSSDVRVWSIEPPVPLKMRLYRCDKTFVLDILAEMLETNEVYGLVVLDRREANLALLKGKSIVHLAKTSSNVPGKTRAGGQSAQRFARLREGAAKEYYRRVAELMKSQFFGLEGLKGIILGGPGPTKLEFLEQGQLLTDLKNKIIAIKDLSYTGEFGVEELVDKSQDVLANEAIAEEKAVMQEFFSILSKNPNLVCYGYDDTLDKLKMGAVDKLLVSESLDDKTIEELEKMAKEVSTEVKLISTETREGVQLKEMGGVAGILRYQVEGS
ncbi:peptide chain release factor 1 [Candidatus Woesearchaeota archaeon]|nr:MAG: peptide chain release factor 1 [Candidatus Woesearchaeota archaeon]